MGARFSRCVPTCCPAWITDHVDSRNSTALFGPPAANAHAGQRFMPDAAFEDLILTEQDLL